MHLANVVNTVLKRNWSQCMSHKSTLLDMLGSAVFLDMYCRVPHAQTQAAEALGRTVLPNWLGLRSWLTAWAESKLAGQPRARSWVSTTTTWQVVCKKNRVYKFIQEHSGWIPLRKLEYGTSPALRILKELFQIGVRIDYIHSGVCWRGGLHWSTKVGPVGDIIWYIYDIII